MPVLLHPYIECLYAHSSARCYFGAFEVGIELEVLCSQHV